jgi:bifunctional non-homologous end joining protein LigD
VAYCGKMSVAEAVVTSASAECGRSQRDLPTCNAAATPSRAGKVRAGFVPHLRREIFKALKPHHVDECPFVDLPNPKASRWGGGVRADEMREMRGMRWVKPELVVQIRFVEWTVEGRLRHAAFLGLRTDKEAREVRRE